MIDPAVIITAESHGRSAGAEPEQPNAYVGWLVAASDLLIRCSTILVAVLMAVLVIVMFIGVVFRYGLDDALPWTEEVAGFAMGWLVFVGAAVLFGKDGHPRSTLLLVKLGPRARRSAEAFAEAATGIYLLTLIGAGAEILQLPLPHSPALSISYAFAYLAIPLAGALMLVHWLRKQSERRGRSLRLLVILPALGIGAMVIALAGSGSSLLDNIPMWAIWLTLPVAFLIGVPVAIILGFGATFLVVASSTVPLSIVAQRAYAGIDNPAFLAIPAFMLTGSLMLVTGMSDGLVAFASALVGRVRGGLALADVLASVLFADISGSAVADTAAIGTTLMPGMVRRGYDRDFVAAHQAASGSLGTLFPPSISMIIFATVTSVSVTGLFLGSIVPGLIVAISYMFIAYVVACRRGYPREERSTAAGIAWALIRALPALVAPLVVLGGILFGIFTPYEAGAVAAVYVAVAGAIIRPGSLASYGAALVEGATTSAMVLFIIANASVLAWLLIGQQIPQGAAAFVASLTEDPFLILILVSALLIALSVFLEPPAILIAVIPILLPIVTSVGITAVQFGVVVMITGAIGMLLPPIGITLLVSVAIIQSSIERAARAAIPYVAVACLDLLLVIAFPALTSWLPKFVHP